MGSRRPTQVIPPMLTDTNESYREVVGPVAQSLADIGGELMDIAFAHSAVQELLTAPIITRLRRRTVATSSSETAPRELDPVPDPGLHNGGHSSGQCQAQCGGHDHARCRGGDRRSSNDREDRARSRGSARRVSPRSGPGSPRDDDAPARSRGGRCEGRDGRRAFPSRGRRLSSGPCSAVGRGRGFGSADARRGALRPGRCPRGSEGQPASKPVGNCPGMGRGMEWGSIGCYGRGERI